MTLRVRPYIRPLNACLGAFVGGTGHNTQFRRGLELTLRCDNELLGLGEASPLPQLSDERLEDVELEFAQLKAFEVDLPKRPAECLAWIGKVTEPWQLRCASARYAVEGALVDLLSRHFAIPAAVLVAHGVNADCSDADLLGTEVPNAEVPHSELEISRLLPNTDQLRLVDLAHVAWARGYRTLKLKLGPVANFEQDCAKLEAIRTQLPSTVKIRLDPNASWAVEMVPHLLDRLSQYSPELVEEPVRGEDLPQLGRSPVPIAVDESLRQAGLLDRLAPHIEQLNIRSVVIKPALIGLVKSIELAKAAKRLGLDVIVTHLFDGPIGHATAVVLAQAVGSRARAHGLAPHPGLLLCPERRIVGLGAGQLSIAAQPGLPLVEVPH